MRLARAAAAPILFALAAAGVFLVDQLADKANHAYAMRRKASAAELPPPGAMSAWSQTFYFDRAASPPGVLVAGWSTPEPGAGVWSDERAATLRLPPAPGPGAVEVALTVEAFLAPGRPFQRVRVSSGGRPLGDWRLAAAGPTTLRIAAPHALRAPSGDLTLNFELPDADTPSRLVEGSPDPRILAIKLQRVTVTG